MMKITFEIINASSYDNELIASVKKLGSYVLSNLDRFDSFVQEVSDAFDAEYNGKYSGSEWIGSGVSQSGPNFSISDLAIVDLVFAPAIRARYEKEGILFITKIVESRK